MFQKFYEFSRLFPRGKKWENLNEGMPEIYDRGLAICFDEDGKFSSIESVVGNENVVYRAGPSNGTDYTPCCKLAGTTNKRILKAVKEFVKAKELPLETKDWLDKTIKNFELGQSSIWEMVQEKEKLIGIDGKEHRGYVFWAKKIEEKIYPVYEWHSCKDNMVNLTLKNWSEKGGMSDSGACYICGRDKRVVFGNFSILACYNLDKKGSIAGGFKEREGYKNFPVCEECCLDIARAVILVRKDLSSKMAGQTYMILPCANSREVREELFEILRNNPHRFKLSNQHDLVAEEWNILEEFNEYGNQIAFGLIFYKEDNASWRIQAEVQQVLPSRIKELYNAFTQIKNANDLVSGKENEKKPLLINARLICNFSASVEKKSEDTFRSWMVALFEKRKINYKHFLHSLVKCIVTTGKKNESFMPWTVRQAWGFYRYALLTKLIENTKQGGIMDNVIPLSAYGKYVLEHHEFFNCPEKIVAFLTGCYSSMVTYIQQKERKSAPFAKKFIGRLLTQKHLQRLYREGHAKLAQYNALGLVIKGLDPDIASGWVACGNMWDISDEEATFAFVIGYSLAYRISKLYDEDIENDNNKQNEEK